MGHQGDTMMIAAIGLGNMIQQVFVFGVVFGFNGTAENDMSKAYGANNLRNCSIYHNRGKLVLAMSFIFIIIAFLNVERFLVLCG